MTLLLTISVLLLAIVLMSVRVIVKKNGRFSSQHIGQSKAMRDRGIACVNTQDYDDRQPNLNKIDVKNL